MAIRHMRKDTCVHGGYGHYSAIALYFAQTGIAAGRSAEFYGSRSDIEPNALCHSYNIQTQNGSLVHHFSYEVHHVL